MVCVRPKTQIKLIKVVTFPKRGGLFFGTGSLEVLA